MSDAALATHRLRVLSFGAACWIGGVTFETLSLLYFVSAAAACFFGWLLWRGCCK